MQYQVEVSYMFPEEIATVVNVDNIGMITEDFLTTHLDLPQGSKIVDFTINAV
ncbi:MAG TPA: hypothetical protein VEP90_13250 [Methylomirabilota bacterium]|nr:hypothetical protein [Methylomirabilota bacterium]